MCPAHQSGAAEGSLNQSTELPSATCLSLPRGPFFRGSIRRSITERPRGSFDLFSLGPFLSPRPLPRHVQCPRHISPGPQPHPTQALASFRSAPLPAPGHTGPGNYPPNGSVYLTLSACSAKQTAAQLHRLNNIQAN